MSRANITSVAAKLLSDRDIDFEVLVGVDADKGESSTRRMARAAFWAQLMQHAQAVSPTHRSLTATPPGNSAVQVHEGPLAWQYATRRDETQAALYLRCDAPADTERLFDALFAQRGRIEAAFGSELEWDRGDGQKSSRVLSVVADGG